MKVRVSNFKNILREFLEDVDRVRRHKDGYGDDLEEDSDRVRRHKDGYGDELEETDSSMVDLSTKAREHEKQDNMDNMPPMPPVKADFGKDPGSFGKEEVPLEMQMPLLAVMMGENDNDSLVSREKAKKIMKHGHISGKSLSKAQKGLFGMLAGSQEPTKLKKDK